LVPSARKAKTWSMGRSITADPLNSCAMRTTPYSGTFC
jgi:hypothetical protein